MVPLDDNSRFLLRSVLGQLVRSEYPDCAVEFDLVFDTVLRAAESEAGDTAMAWPARTLPFNSTPESEPSVAWTIIVGLHLLNEINAYSSDSVSARLDELESFLQSTLGTVPLLNQVRKALCNAHGIN